MTLTTRLLLLLCTVLLLGIVALSWTSATLGARLAALEHALPAARAELGRLQAACRQRPAIAPTDP